ncbi:PQQ-dependent sugar dehydrogenase [Spirosoma sp. KCTC 42546]|uniref:PQQ-dependent sugar dehydrogenase n=1 Tax=Spirosoma sp. KCTC 42546 TaxID=2520506 RepID=UPI001157758C|nr:PQQ-dependent sugar dehydrogenase [Spirosoma sp. KCTC 42546]QDK79391.1 PQQ-dependent sugar dehydrogenase [Spirosoma sp. KCTC 42546]
MKGILMFSKTIVTFVISLIATSGVSWIVAIACQPAKQADAIVADSTGSMSGTALVKVVNAYPKLTFDSPVEYTYANDGTNRVFVVEQAGRIRVVENDANTASAGIYLDIRSKVASGGEMGLLGLAFHPDFKQNGFFYVNYTKSNPRETIVSRFKASSANASTVDPGSEVILFRFDQPYSNHNGGKVLFGPDGYLYVSTGDGGSGGDPQNNGQNRSSWLGKILRVDVNSTDKGQYGIPKDNPFKGNTNGYREEIFAYGLRNPWRISFDEKGQLWVGDVGQNAIEEVDIVTKGGNYGWRLKEGNANYNTKDNANAAELIAPIWQYSHSNGDVSITGGVVYRGSTNPDLRGKYIYADYASGRVWALTPNGTKSATNQELVSGAGAISAFGEDQKNELYLCEYGGGKILKLMANN